jgi:hypothetical protein
VETTKSRKRKPGNELSSEVVRRQDVAGTGVRYFDSRRLRHPSLALGLLSAPLLAGGLRPSASPNRLDSRRLHYFSIANE